MFCRVLLLFVVVFVVVRNWLIWSISFRVTPLELGQSYDCPSASEVTLKKMGKWITWKNWQYHDNIRKQIKIIYTENKRSSISQLWWHRKLSLWQLTVPPVTTKLSKWWPFVFSVHNLRNILLRQWSKVERLALNIHLFVHSFVLLFIHSIIHIW